MAWVEKTAKVSDESLRGSCPEQIHFGREEGSDPRSDLLPVLAALHPIKQERPTIQLTNDAKTYFWSFS